ncbi:hypothetical protein HQ865_12000 [Mucilaginibacter mali]|uniref:Glycosyltransferase involved in cell wall biosynthesis n=1 Tax=Mucilaginibacter mali TaxID=2740462 RepID=A0A7D4PU72_9SPHI|nr:glycosyltransferase [Mucilaginibacter mali]QKJ30448.1 hypothetical protein HQ865_12000 [Mucilaginibacter mali]
MKYKVLLVSAGQPSLNPRLVKEADTLADNGYDVTVIYAYWNAWGTQLDDDLIPSKKWTALRAGGDPIHRPGTYFLSRILFKLANAFTRITGLMSFAPAAISRSSIFLQYEAARHKADIYIGHNLGALPAVVKAAKKYGKPCGFDAEDFHRNEVTDDSRSLDARMKTAIEDKYIPQLNYLSVSSPLIGNVYQQLYPQIKQQVLLNAFPKNRFIKADETSTGILKLFWFSQTVGPNRGIEQIINALQYLKDNAFELHLLGDADATIRDAFTSRIHGAKSIVHFYPPIPPDDIFKFASQFDIGIASENHTPLNRDICLTNKIFTYVQAGLPVLASNTTAQLHFMQQYAVAGKTYNSNGIGSIAEALSYYQNNPEALIKDKRHNYVLGQSELNWDTEEQQFLSLVNQTI